jgi:hypothetical protein
MDALNEKIQKVYEDIVSKDNILLKEAMPPKKIIEILRNNLKSYKKEEKISPNDEGVISKFLDWVTENQF